MDAFWRCFFILVLHINNLSLEYGERKLFKIPDLSVYANDKIGIIGENGAGKTSLLNLIAGKIVPTTGACDVRAPYSYIPQSVTEHADVKPDKLRKLWQVPKNALSGGERMRAQIAKALAEDKDLLICDEPTSNLDEAGIIQLEEALRKLNKAVLLVSHDRALMDSVCTKIWEIAAGEVRVYPGNYSAYQAQKEKERQNQQKEYDKYLRTKASLEQALVDRSQKAKSMTKTPKRMGNSEARLHRMDVRQRAGKVSASAKNIQSRLGKLEEKAAVKPETHYHIAASTKSKRLSKYAVSIRDLSVAYEGKSVLEHLSLYVKRGERVCIVGKNGCGKTTLLNSIAGQAEGVQLAPGSTFGYFDQNGLSLDDDASILDFVIKTSQMPEHVTRTVLAELGVRRDEVYKKIHQLSGGERNKTALASLICQQCDVLLMDEPTNYMDIYMLEALERMLTQYQGTLIFVSHDRAFRKAVATRTMQLVDGKLVDTAQKQTQKAGNVAAKILLLEMKAAALIEQKKGVSEAEQSKLEAEYFKIMEEIKHLKQ